MPSSVFSAEDCPYVRKTEEAEKYTGTSNKVTMQINAYKYLVAEVFLLIITPAVNIFQLDSLLIGF